MSSRSASMACRIVPVMFSSVMDRVLLSSIILAAPAWARVGLTMRDPQMRERAADALAATIVEQLEEPPALSDRNQLSLPI